MFTVPESVLRVSADTVLRFLHDFGIIVLFTVLAIVILVTIWGIVTSNVEKAFRLLSRVGLAVLQVVIMIAGFVIVTGLANYGYRLNKAYLNWWVLMGFIIFVQPEDIPAD